MEKYWELGKNDFEVSAFNPPAHAARQLDQAIIAPAFADLDFGAIMNYQNIFIVFGRTA